MSLFGAGGDARIWCLSEDRPRHIGASSMADGFTTAGGRVIMASRPRTAIGIEHCHPVIILRLTFRAAGAAGRVQLVFGLHEMNESVTNCELSVVIPFLNEADTIATCVGKAIRSMQEAGIAGEVIVSDNGSTDGSVEIAKKMGARGVHTLPS